MPLQGMADGINAIGMEGNSHEPTYNLAGQHTTDKRGVLVRKNKKFILK